MIYFAYGSNLNIGQMSYRCPGAVALGWAKLKDWRLVFRGVADCVREEGAFCYGGVWRLTPECERTLDVYEGIRSGMYRREMIPLARPCDGEHETLIYTMNSIGIMPPSAAYLRSIEQGYRDFRLPKVAHKMLARAVQDAWDDKAPTHIERQRHRRNGRPALAQPKRDPGHASDRVTNHAGSTKEKSNAHDQADENRIGPLFRFRRPERGGEDDAR